MSLALRAGLLVRGPVALWRVCVPGRGAEERGPPARILMFPGTPRRLARELTRPLAYLARRFRVVPLQPERLRAGTIALTFDDGLRSNVEVAYPILARLGIPATFFVCPALIDEGRWLWTHEARARLHARGADAATTERLLAYMKTLPLEAREELEEGLRADTADYEPSAAEREAYDLAGWEELARLDPGIVTLGSHTLTHPVLPHLGREEAEREIVGSRERLEARLGRRVELFCYPNGDVDARSLEIARRTYRIAVTASPGAVAPRCDPLLLPRLAAPRGLLRLAWRVQP